jgi:hypothetical protein
MYLADAIGYLGYSVVLVIRESHRTVPEILPYFRVLLLVLAGLSFVAIILSQWYFQRAIVSPERSPGKNVEWQVAG